MARIIRYFCKIDDSLAGERELPHIDISVLQKIFSVPDDDPMYFSYPIMESQAGAISDISNVDFDLERYDYFLEYEE